MTMFAVRFSVASTLTLALLAGCGGGEPLPVPLEPVTPQPPPSPRPPSPHHSYQLIELGTLGGQSSMPVAIDAEGRIVGWAEAAWGDRHAFVWDGRMHSLPTPTAGSLATAFGPDGIIAGTLTSNGTSSAAIWQHGVLRRLGDRSSGTVAVNERGDVLAIGSAGEYRVDPLLYRQGSEIMLGHLGTSRLMTLPAALNNSGVVVGSSYAQESGPHDFWHAFVWANGTLRDLGTLAARPCRDTTGDCSHARALDINDAGDIVGVSTDSSGTGRPVIWRGGGRISDLGLPPDWSGSASHINSAGQIVVRVWRPGSEATVLWMNGNVAEIQPPTGMAASPVALNEHGVIAGTLGGNGTHRAFVWHDGQLAQLDDDADPAAASFATGLNDRGDVIGYIGGPGGRTRAVLWRRARP